MQVQGIQYIKETVLTRFLVQSTFRRFKKDDLVKLWNVVKSQTKVNKKQKDYIKSLYNSMVHLLCKAPNSCLCSSPKGLSFVISVAIAKLIMEHEAL